MRGCLRVQARVVKAGPPVGGAWPPGQRASKAEGASALRDMATVLFGANRPFQFRQIFLVRVTKDKRHLAGVVVLCTEAGSCADWERERPGVRQAWRAKGVPSFHSSETNLSEDWWSSVATLSFRGSMFFISHSSAL